MELLVAGLKKGVSGGLPETGNLPEDIKLNVYPNPFDREFTIRIDAPDEDLYTISIVDMNGRTIYLSQDVPVNTEITIDRQFKTGTYFIIAKNGKARIVKQIVKY